MSDGVARLLIHRSGLIKFRAMRDGRDGAHGSPGNEEFVSCGFCGPLKGANPPLSARPLFSII